MLFHFFENASARRSPEAFNEVVLKIANIPYLYVIEVAVLLVPILFHSIFGLFITGTSRPNVTHYPYGRNWAYLLQRVTGVLAFFYIGFHVASTRVWALFVKHDHYTFADMNSSLSSPLVLAIYVIGILACTFHLSNGIWSFSITWGLVKSQKAQKQLACLSMLMFFVLAVVGLDILSAFVVEHGVISQIGKFLFG